MNTCGIIGHRKYNEDLALETLLEELILKYQINCFNFGTKSEFTLVCAKCIERLQKKYPHILMRAFLVRGELCFLKEQKNLAKYVHAKQVFYDEIFETIFDSKLSSYIKRDKAIIENSDMIFCYYKYETAINKQKTETRSGTSLAINYAKKLNKKILNVAN